MAQRDFEKRVAYLIREVCKRNPKKREQLEKVRDISAHLTSADGIHVETEMYSGGIIRFCITGTRCGMVITYDPKTWKIVRKKRGEKPWWRNWCSIYVSDILD